MFICPAAGEHRDTCKDHEDKATDTASPAREKVWRRGRTRRSARADSIFCYSILYERAVDIKGKGPVQDSEVPVAPVEDPNSAMQDIQADAAGRAQLPVPSVEPQISISSPPKPSDEHLSPQPQHSSPSMVSSQAHAPPVVQEDQLRQPASETPSTTVNEGVPPPPVSGGDISMLLDP